MEDEVFKELRISNQPPGMWDSLEAFQRLLRQTRWLVWMDFDLTLNPCCFDSFSFTSLIRPGVSGMLPHVVVRDSPKEDYSHHCANAGFFVVRFRCLTASGPRFRVRCQEQRRGTSLLGLGRREARLAQHPIWQLRPKQAAIAELIMGRWEELKVLHKACGTKAIRLPWQSLFWSSWGWKAGNVALESMRARISVADVLHECFEPSGACHTYFSAASWGTLATPPTASAGALSWTGWWALAAMGATG